ncbi:MAG TPA: glycosyltransferase family 4 protein [Candidatus Paceibacterota bacterium]|nr:glycosyltransferase family 4 protein [Candidatus Paceibacterota bacterium]
MKIAFISPHTFTYPGGVQKHTLSLKKEFEKKGHIVKIIYPREKIHQKRGKDEILLGGSLVMPGNASRTNLSLNVTPLSIKRRLKKEKFDVLHFQNFGAFLPWQVLGAVDQLEKKPLKILTFHAFLDASRIFKDVPFFMDILNDYILPRFDGVIGVSKPVLSQIKYNGFTKIIPNGVDLDFFNPRGEKIEKFCAVPLNNNLCSGPIINILFVGRIEKRKGLIYLVKAFEILKNISSFGGSNKESNFKNIRLIIVGDGDKKEDIERYVKKHHIPDVFFEGRAKEEDLPKYYRTADICCFPSLYGEAFGIVLLEAMASGKPVVAFANQGYKEVLVDKGADFLVQPKDVQGLVQRLKILIKDDKKRKEMGEWGRQEAEKYSWEEIANQTLKFYKEAINYKIVS